MGLFGMFGSKATSENNSENSIKWKRLTSIGQLDTIEAASKTKTVAIFKHSTRCGISRMVLRNFESSFTLSEDAIDMYYLDLLSFRDVSDEVGYRFQVMHQSPQLIVIKNGVAVANASHHSIQASDLAQFV